MWGSNHGVRRLLLPADWSKGNFPTCELIILMNNRFDALTNLKFSVLYYTNRQKLHDCLTLKSVKMLTICNSRTWEVFFPIHQQVYCDLLKCSRQLKNTFCFLRANPAISTKEQNWIDSLSHGKVKFPGSRPFGWKKLKFLPIENLSISWDLTMEV